jgi:Tfp pilus assembly protein PilV
LASEQNGFTMVDSLIAVLVLSVGLVLYTKNWTANFGAKNSTHARSIAATQVAEIGNVLLANIADLDQDAPRGAVVSRVQQFSNTLVNHINSFANARGYECGNQGPKLGGSATNSSSLNNSTLPRTWAQGAAACVSIKPMPSLNTDTNGVWVEIETSWIDSHTLEGQTESVRVYTLVSPL